MWSVAEPQTSASVCRFTEEDMNRSLDLLISVNRISPDENISSVRANANFKRPIFEFSLLQDVKIII